MIEDEHKTDFTASVGVNLTHDLSIGNAMAESALPDEGGNGGTGFGDLNCPPRLAAFSVYYDDTTKSLKMVDPQVVVCGKEVKCDALSNVEDGIYYCNVRCNTSSNEYEAKVEPVMAIDSADSKAVCSVKLFKLEGEEFTQYHAGVIALYDIGAKLVVQGKESAGSVTLDASGNSPTLSIVKDGKSITIDESVLESGDESVMSIKTIKWPKKATEEDSSTTSSTHILAGKDIDISDLTGTDYSADTGIKISDGDDGGKKIKNMGVLSIAFGNSTQQLNGTLKIVGAEGSGLEVTGTDFSGAGEDGQAVDYTNGTCNFDLQGRGENDEFAVRTVTLPKKDGAEAEAAKTVKVLATNDFDLSDLGGGVTIEKADDDDNIIEVTSPSGNSKAYKLKVPKGVTKINAGTGITISPEDGTGAVTISSKNPETTGYSGSVNVLTAVSYAHPNLKMTTVSLTIKNGLVTSVGSATTTTWHTAVEETT